MNGFFTNVKKEVPIEGGIKLLADSRLKTGDTAYRVNGKIRKLCKPNIGIGRVANSAQNSKGMLRAIAFPSNAAIKTSVLFLVSGSDINYTTNQVGTFSLSGHSITYSEPGTVQNMPASSVYVNWIFPIGANKVLLRYSSNTTVIFDKSTPGSVTTLTDISTATSFPGGVIGLSDTLFVVTKYTNRSVVVYSNNSPGSEYTIPNLTNTNDVGTLFYVNATTFGYIGKNTTGNPFIVIGTISGTVVTWGSAYTLTGTYTNTNSYKGVYLEDNKLIIAFVDTVSGSAAKYYSMPITVSGTVVSMGTVTLEKNYTSNVIYNHFTAFLDSSNYMSLIMKNGSDSLGSSIQDTVNIEYNFNNFNTEESLSSFIVNGLFALGGRNHFLLIGRDSGNGYAKIFNGGEILGYANDSSSYEGIAQNDAFPGQPVVLKKSGSYSYGHKGLTTGTTYYVNTTDGTLTTTDTGITAGVAITDKILKVN